MAETNPYEPPLEDCTPGPKQFEDMIRRFNFKHEDSLIDAYYSFRKNHPSVRSHEEHFLLFLKKYFAGAERTELPDIAVTKAGIGSKLRACFLHPFESAMRAVKGTEIVSPSIEHNAEFIDFDALFNSFVEQSNIQCKTRVPIPILFRRIGQTVVFNDLHADGNDILRIGTPIRYGDALYLRRDNDRGYLASGRIVNCVPTGGRRIQLTIYYSNSDTYDIVNLKIVADPKNKPSS